MFKLHLLALCVGREIVKYIHINHTSPDTAIYISLPTSGTRVASWGCVLLRSMSNLRMVSTTRGFAILQATVILYKTLSGSRIDTQWVRISSLSRLLSGEVSSDKGQAMNERNSSYLYIHLIWKITDTFLFPGSDFNCIGEHGHTIL